MGRVADLAIGFPGYWGRPPRENGFLSEILRANGYATYAVGKWHLTPEDETNMAALAEHVAARARVRPLVRLPRRRDPPVRPALYHDNHRPAAAPISEGYHRARTWPIGPSRTSGTSAPSTPSGPFFLYFAPAPATHPSRAGRVDRPLQGPLRRGVGQLARARPSPASSATASSPGGPGCRPDRPGCRLGLLRRERARGGRSASWSASPASCPTPTSRSGGCSASSTTSARATTRS